MMTEENMRFLWNRIRRMKSEEVAKKIESSIKEYYESKNVPVPRWRTEKNPTWWVDYLVGLGMDPNNP